MGVTVVGLIVSGNLFGRPFIRRIEEEFSTSVVDDCRLVACPAWVGKPDLFSFLVCEGFEVCHRRFAHIEVSKIKNTTRNGLLKSLLIFETDSLFIHGKTDASEDSSFVEFTLNTFIFRDAVKVRGHQVVARSLFRRICADEDSAIFETAESPGIELLRSEGDFLAGFCSNFAGEYPISLATGSATVPDWGITSVAGPGLVEVGMSSVCELMKLSAICIDDTDCGFPITDLFCIHKASEEDELVVGLRPRWFKIPVAMSDWFDFGSAKDVYVDLAVFIIGGAMFLLSTLGIIEQTARDEER